MLELPTKVLVGLLAFLGVSALGGGTAMMMAPDGAVIGLDTAPLADVPLIEDWLVPGLFLAAVLGFGALSTAWAILRLPARRRAAPPRDATGHQLVWVASLAIGLILVAFISYEAQIVTAAEGRWLQWLMGGTGVAIAVLTSTTPVRRDLTR